MVPEEEAEPLLQLEVAAEELLVEQPAEIPVVVADTLLVVVADELPEVMVEEAEHPAELT